MPRQLGLSLALVWVGCSGTVGSSQDVPSAEGPANLPETPSDNPGITPDEPDPLEPLTPLVRRLTRDEYTLTVADLLGVTLSPEDVQRLPTDRPLEGFVNIASGQTTLPDHVRAYSQLAERIVAQLDWDAFLADYSGCTEVTETCGRAFVEYAGGRLFRRPVTDPQADTFTQLFAAIAAEGLTWAQTTAAVMQAMLQSPPFLYLLEDAPETTATIGSYAMAQRLSYFLWLSAPDEALLSAAASGALDTPDGIRTQVQRMLADETKVARSLDRYLVDWARMESLPDEDGLRPELIAAATAFYRGYVFEGAPVFELFSTPQAYLTPALATNYGVPPAGDGIQKYDVSGLSERGGLLGQPGVLAGMTNADGGAIVARGLFLQKQLFCGEPPDPPASLQEIIDEFLAEQPDDASDRQIAEVRLMRPSCGACHRQFDPLAYGFERFDFRGRYRTEDEHQNPLTTDGWIPGGLTGGEDQPYSDLNTYQALLATQVEVRRCWIQRQIEYAVGHRLERGQRAAVFDIETQLAPGGDYAALMEAIATHDVFRTVAR